MSELGSPVVQGSEEEVHLALAACDTAFFVHGDPDRMVWLTNPRGEELVGLRENQLVGRRVSDFLSGPPGAVKATLEALESGFVDESRSRRTLRRATGTLVPVWVWSRAVTVGGRRGIVSLVTPMAEVGLAGRDPEAPWRSLATVVVGLADRDWRVEAVSKDVASLSTRCAEALVGRSLLEVLEPADRDGGWAGGRGARQPAPVPPRRARLRCPSVGTVDVWFLYSPLWFVEEGRPARPRDDGRRVFTLIGTVNPRAAKEESARVRELELHLQRIGAEVRAANVIRTVADFEPLGDPAAVPELGDLTTRQWAILSRIARGERVPQIAADLYLSQSTVRNHLSAIFQKFGVHSQPELLAKIRALREGTASVT